MVPGAQPCIFDTQILALFHRKKEIGTLMAMGLTRRQVTVVFLASFFFFLEPIL